MRRYHRLILLCLVLFGGAVRADEVVLTNGDHLSGTIVQMTGGKLVFKSPAAGDVTVNLTDVQTLSSAAPVTLQLSDGTVLIRRLHAGQPGQVVVEPEGAIGAQAIGLSSVTAINPPPKPEPKWTGSITGGFTATSGNTTTESINASMSVQRRSEKDRIIAGGDYGRSKLTDPDTKVEKTTEDWWRTKAEYDYFFRPKFFGFVNGRYENDKIAELDRRVVIGGGAGYQWIESDPMNFSTQLGLASLYERFRNQTDSRSELSLDAGYAFDAQLNKSVKFLHDLTIFPALSKFSEYYLTTTAELRASLTTSMFANFKVIFDYTTTPANNRGNTDVKYIFGAGVTF